MISPCKHFFASQRTSQRLIVERTNATNRRLCSASTIAYKQRNITAMIGRRTTPRVDVSSTEKSTDVLDLISVLKLSSFPRPQRADVSHFETRHWKFSTYPALQTSLTKRKRYKRQAGGDFKHSVPVCLRVLHFNYHISAVRL